MIDLSKVPTCDLQTELEKREGVSYCVIRYNEDAGLVVNGNTVMEHAGPMTVTFNWD